MIRTQLPQTTREVHFDGSIDLSCNLRGTLINVASHLVWKLETAALYYVLPCSFFVKSEAIRDRDQLTSPAEMWIPLHPGN